MKKLLIALGFLLIPVLAHAEFSAAEKAEIAKIIVQQSNIAVPFNQVGDGIRDYGTEPLRPAFVATMTAAVDAAWECHEALRGLFQVSGFTTQDGFTHTGLCQANGLVFADSLDTLANTVVAANSSASAASWAVSVHTLATKVRQGQVGTFNYSLAYANPRNPSFPTVVGPHGDFESAEEHLAEMGEMFLRAVALGTALYRVVDVWPQTANGDFREFIRYAVTPTKNAARIWGLEHGIYAFTGDVQDVQDDIAAASAIGVQRGETFFITLHQDELFNGTPHQPPLHSGRVQSGGSVQNFAIGFAEFPKAWRAIINANTKEEIVTWFDGTVKNLGATASVLARINSNIIPQWSEALSSAWEAGDEWNNSIFMFFHTVVNVCGPGTHAEGGQCVPDGGTGGGLVCGPGTHEASGQCLPDSTLSCGAGTHVEGNTCVADPCPVCPPPPVCPTFHAEIQLTGQDSAQAVCVQNP